MGMNFKFAFGRIVILLSSVGMLAFSCEEQKPDLIGCWTNAYEEGYNIYKGCNVQSFSPSHFRQVYDFHDDGTVNYLVLHPADAHYMQEAKWVYVGSKNEVHIRELQNNQVIVKLKYTTIDSETIEIVEVQ